MRYYSLAITTASGGGQTWVPTTGGDLVKGSGTATFSSQLPGQNGSMVNNPGALNIQFDIPVVPFNTPQGKQIITVWGVGLKMLGSAANLNGQFFTLSAGMMKGLPLATAASQVPGANGVIAQGQIFQAYGNWQGVTQTLELIVFPGGLDAPNGISFNWQPGNTLASALSTTAAQAFPDYTVSAPSLITSLQPPDGAVQSGSYPSLQTFAEYLQQLTQPIGEAAGYQNYPGVQLSIGPNSTIVAQDGSSPAKTVTLAFQDLIGQPTWIAANQISFKTVLRGDINIGDQIVLPTGVGPPYALTSPNAAVPNAPARAKSGFQGKYVVIEVHHFANFRQADADSWVTNYVAVAPVQAPPPPS